ncbi:MAG TPA: ABC transporter ATP-binding protein, partial [Caldithrix abyssi]|nr:ABC transporter ATP-binding protein [Caldithrix abyssi]
GCGKTTILRLIAGFIAPDTGRIYLNGALTSWDGRILIPPEKRNIGMVFQDLALWPHLTVSGNIGFGLKAKRIPKTEREAKIKDILQLVGLEGYAKRKPAELSGGQQQRVALARALVLQPNVLLMDEPLSNLDRELNVRLRDEVVRLQEQLGFTLLYVTHDREEAFHIARTVILMRDGRVEFKGRVEEAKRVIAGSLK